MRVTPLDIRKQEFKKVMRGLDSEEVFAFLNTIAEEYEVVLSDNKQLRERLVALEDRLNEYKAIETNLRNTLLTAEKLTHEAKENARREASLLIREAEMEAEKAAESIRAHTSQLRREILELKKNKDNYVTRLKSLLDSHKKMLEGFEGDFAEVDQAIEQIGKQVEDDARKSVAPPRMSRDKITENFGHEPKDKVTWGEERRREDEQRPQMPRPGFETRENPNQKAKPPEDTLGIFGAPASERPAPHTVPVQQPATREMPPRAAEQSRVEPIGAKVADASPQQTYPSPAPQTEPERPQPQDEWRQYDVRKQPTDWKSYEIQGQHPQQAPPAPQAQQPVPREEDREFESALSNLKEATDAVADMQRRDMSQMPGQRQAPAQSVPPPQAPAAQPVQQEPKSDVQWSMEELRRNLTNLTKNEGNQG